MNKERIRYLVISDIHLGNKRNSTSEIINALDVFFDHYRPRDDLDIIFLAGDVFDVLLDFPSDDVPIITNWVRRLEEFCGLNKIKLRILEGTRSHDWGQSKVFETVHRVVKSKTDLKYIDTLFIETISDLGITVLYVPDEWNVSTDRTFEQVKALMAENHLTQVDIAIMHGLFQYQAPVQAVKIPKHIESNYLKIVKYFISIGHIHTSSVYERILAQGSFDRLSHNEEEAKGGMLCDIYRDGRCEYFFIENKLSKKFITLLIRQKDIDSALLYIEKKAKTVPNGSYIRLKARSDHPVILGFEEIKKKFITYVLTKITIEEETEDQQHNLVADITTPDEYIPIAITSDNIRSMLFNAIQTKYSLTEHQYQIMDRELLDVI